MINEESVSVALIFHPDKAARTLADALAIYVGRGRRWSTLDLAAATGIPQTSLRSYCDGSRSPSYASLASLCSVLGGEFATRLFVPVGLGVFDIPDDDGASKLDTVQLLARAMTAVAENAPLPEHTRRADEARNVWPVLASVAGREMRRNAA